MTLIAIISVKSEQGLTNDNPIKIIRANSPRSLEEGLLYFFIKEGNQEYNAIGTSEGHDLETYVDYYQTDLDVGLWYYSFLDKLDLQKKYEFVDKVVLLPESDIKIYDLKNTYRIKLLVCPENSIFSTCNKFLVGHQSDIKELSLTPYQELAASDHTRITMNDVIEVLDSPVYLHEDPKVTKIIRDTVHLKDIEGITKFRYNILYISNAKMGTEEEEWTIGYGGGHSGPSYIKKGTRNVDVLNKFLQKVKTNTIILPDNISRRHINTIIKNDNIKKVIVNEDCKLFSMHEGKLYNKKKTKLVMNPR